VCGICGIASPGTGPEIETLRSMSSAMVHRGPDSDGLFIDEAVGLAARRLAIIDVEGGDQPIANEDGSIRVVHNGEIYNHRELRTRLVRRGHAFATETDAEVLVHLYEEMGTDLVQELRGMFAFALWDAVAGELLIARDRFGIKPLYYHQRGGRLTFASELNALLRDRSVSKDLDVHALESFFAFNSIPGRRSIYRDVEKLRAGHALVWKKGTVRVHEYALPRPVPEAEVWRGCRHELAAELLERMRDSVRAHLVSDVPVGVLLSGGIDSSTLTALAARETGAGLKTFSIGFEERSFDELRTARLVARQYGTEHHELVVRPDAAAVLPRLAKTFDEPFGDSSALPTYLVCELAATHLKVVLSGEGADEMFGGYYTYVADLMAPRLAPLTRLARPFVERLPSSEKRTSFDYKAKRFVRGAQLPPLERHHAWKEIFSNEARHELLQHSDEPAPDPLDVYRECWAETTRAEQLARLQDLDLRVYLVDDLLVKVDRASMAHSLEARVPFLDRAVSELALALPSSLKVQGLSKKRLLRDAVRPLLPRAVIEGRKRGFSIPAAAWLRGKLEPFAREVLSPTQVLRRGYLRPDAVTRILDRHVSGSEDLSRQLWGLLMLSLWLDENGPG
jgi:asparagine synthase (glutamine-hydrolysing)